MQLPEFLISDDSNDYEVIGYDCALLVPVETLDAKTKQNIADDDTEKILKWTSFPCIPVSTLVEKLKEHGLFEELLEECRESRKELDAEEES